MTRSTAIKLLLMNASPYMTKQEVITVPCFTIIGQKLLEDHSEGKPVKIAIKTAPANISRAEKVWNMRLKNPLLTKLINDFELR